MKASEAKKSAWPPWLTPNVLALGLVALFTDAATEMAMPLLPAFLASLGAGAMVLGLVEGLADFTAAGLKYYSGRLSDHSGRRKPWVLFGYGISSLVRPLLALATASWHVVAVRVADRTGKGLRTSARDAMLAASVPEEKRGAAFGFHQGMDHLGAVLGPLTAVALLVWGGWSERRIFWLTAVPGALAVLAIVAGVREVKLPEKRAEKRIKKASIHLDSHLLRFLIPLGIFTLGSSSDLFLLWKARSDQMPLYGLPLLWAALHVVKSSTSMLGGWMSDRLGSMQTITLGWLVYAALYVAFAFTTDHVLFTGLFIFYGIFYGLSEAPEKSLISKLAPIATQGRVFGWYHLTVGLLALPANMFFGWLYQAVSPAAAFLSGACFAVTGLMLLWILRPSQVR